ncbi:MAG: hypothetical protein ACR2NN_15550 [Bryobacteraceae bacterium]
MMFRNRRLAYYGIPMLFCLTVHFMGLRTWFYLDDFAWLGLRLEVHSFRDLLGVLFRPEAQGTVRTLSERLFFLTFSILFGLNALPFKIWVFLTQFANIALLAQITWRITGSALAGFLTALLWTANPGMAIPLAWVSAYNQIAFSFFILLAFRLFLAYIDTGEAKYWVWQWVVFLFGFGSLELNVVYPVIAAGYALCCARTYLRKTLYLFIPSIAFTAVHFLLISRPDAASYKMYFGGNLWTALWQYLLFALGAVRTSKIDWRPLWLGRSVAVAALLLILFFVFRALFRREYLPLFAFGWFVVVLFPVLPLKNHFTDYYVTVPAIGLAMLSGWAIASIRGPSIAPACLLVAVYLAVAITDIHAAQRFYYNKARKIKHLLTAVTSVQREHPGKTILVEGVDNDTYWLGFYGDPFRLIGVSRIYLVPGSEKAIDPHPEMGGISRFMIPPEDLLPLLRKHDVVVLAFEGSKIRDVTQAYQERLR